MENKDIKYETFEKIFDVQIRLVSLDFPTNLVNTIKDFALNVSKWNYDRDNMHFDYDLEIKMLNEELNEFEVAIEEKDEVATMDAVIDYMFVLFGTFAKITYTAVKTNSPSLITENVPKFNTSLETLETQLLPNVDINKLPECINVVMEANNLKPKDKVDGKIVKGEHWIAPEPKIREILKGN